MTHGNGPLRVGIGGPVGVGKTTLTEQLCRALAHRCSMAVITNDIYTREDADYLTRAQVLPTARIRGVETGGCPHTAIREDASINLAAVADLTRAFPDLDLILIESGGDARLLMPALDLCADGQERVRVLALVSALDMVEAAPAERRFGKLVQVGLFGGELAVPLPVMPMQTACVVRSRESYSSSVPSCCWRCPSALSWAGHWPR